MSDILYIEPNKNRTDNWLLPNRLQLPLSITNYGPIRSVTYPEQKVKGVLIFSENGTSYRPLSNGVKERTESVFGVRVVIEDTIPITDKSGAVTGEADGYYKDGVVHLSKNAKNPLQFVLSHEITHHLQAMNKGAYQYFRMMALRYEAQRSGKAIDELIAEKQNTYKKVGLTKGQAIDEIAADFAGELMQDGKLEELLERIENGELVTDISKGRQIIQSFIDHISLIQKNIMLV